MEPKNAAGTLREIARLLELAGANPYRIRAFTGAARAVETIDDDLDRLIETGEILAVKAIGKGTAAVLGELAEGRRPQALLDAEEAVPPGVREMLRLGGLGPKKVRTLWRELGLETIGELEYACRENRLVELKGFGQATQAAILDALVFFNRSRDRRLIHQAVREAEAVGRVLGGIPEVIAIDWAGELRRFSETVGHLDCVVTIAEGALPGEIAGAIGAAQELGNARWMTTREEGLDARLWFCDPANRAATLLRATGGEAFLGALDPTSTDLSGCTDEASVFEILGLPWIAPELRENASWLDPARDGRLPELVRDDDLRGVLHNHTTDSDGAASLEAMAAAAAARGWSFFGVADHSPVASYANGVDGPRLQKQWGRADAWNLEHPELRIVKGLEADILSDGQLDIPDGCESGLDYVVASVHSAFRLDEQRQTDRVVAAVRHPACRVLGHPTGRLLLARPGISLDLERVLDVCTEHGVAVEINASPYRLDLDSRWARRALDRGLKLVVNPDAHSVEGLDDVRWGLAVARRAGATASDLVNCMEIDDFLKS